MLKEKSIISNHFCICFTSKIYKNSEKKQKNKKKQQQIFKFTQAIRKTLLDMNYSAFLYFSVLQLEKQK